MPSLLLVLATPVLADIDLRNATVDKLDNGLTVILLEDRRFPVVSVQALYRIGARDEVTGKTGLAHYLEHMAFRDSENFPGTDLVSSIYAVGGEWHGYTWTDQTTYFSTVPREHADLLLRIEADRMSALDLQAEDMEAERGAVLAELHMYENLPTSMLIDAVNFTSFLAHPYRNNTIGWESDVVNLQHADIVEFYEQHYHPANAVLAVVGDFDRDPLRARIQELFGPLPRKAATPLPHTVEPPQDGVRRVTLHAPDSSRQFMIAYRAPSANSPDYATFLVLQALIGSSSGVSFLQNDWGTPVASDAPLFDAAEAVTTWYPPSAQDYVFIIGGRAPAGASTTSVEDQVEAEVAVFRDSRVQPETLSRAVDELQRAMEADVETTEDAAHQLAFFDGLGALDVLLELPQRIRAVTAADVQAVAQRYLGPSQRSIAWHLPDTGITMQGTVIEAKELPPARTMEPPGESANPTPFERELGNGLPVVGQVSDFSPLVELLFVFPANDLESTTADDPITGHSSLRYSGRAQELSSLLVTAAKDVAAMEPPSAGDAAPPTEPSARLEQEIRTLLATETGDVKQANRPVLIAVAGDFSEDALVAGLQTHFGDLQPGVSATREAPAIPADSHVVNLDRPIAQAQLGYVARAPGPREPLAEAGRLVLYILSHDYEGRLGKKAITESGLAYYIDSRYRSNGNNAWFTLATGVDPDKLDALRKLFRDEIDRLQSEPPTASELRDARQNRLGRWQSAAQSNSELTTRLASEWLWHGQLSTEESIQQALDEIDQADIEAVIRMLGKGVEVIVRE